MTVKASPDFNEYLRICSPISIGRLTAFSSVSRESKISVPPPPLTRKTDEIWQERCKLMDPYFYQKQENVPILGLICVGTAALLTAGLTTVMAFKRIAAHVSLKVVSHIATAAFGTALLGIYCLNKKVFPNDPTYMSEKGPEAENYILRQDPSYRYIQQNYPGFFNREDINFFLAKRIYNGLQSVAYNKSYYYSDFIKANGKAVLSVLNEENKKRLVQPFLEYLEARDLDLITIKSRFPEWQDLSISEEDLKKVAIKTELEKLFAGQVDYQEFMTRYGANTISSLPPNIIDYVRTIFLQYALKNSISPHQLQKNHPEHQTIFKFDITFYKRLIVLNDFNRFLRKEISYETFKNTHGSDAIDAMPEEKVCEVTESDSTTLEYLDFRRKYGLEIIKILRRNGKTNHLKNKFDEMTNRLSSDKLSQYQQDFVVLGFSYESKLKTLTETKQLDLILSVKTSSKSEEEIKKLAVKFLKRHYVAIFINKEAKLQEDLKILQERGHIPAIVNGRITDILDRLATAETIYTTKLAAIVQEFERAKQDSSPSQPNQLSNVQAQLDQINPLAYEAGEKVMDLKSKINSIEEQIELVKKEKTTTTKATALPPSSAREPTKTPTLSSPASYPLPKDISTNSQVEPGIRDRIAMLKRTASDKQFKPVSTLSIQKMPTQRTPITRKSLETLNKELSEISNQLQEAQAHHNRLAEQIKELESQLKVSSIRDSVIFKDSFKVGGVNINLANLRAQKDQLEKEAENSLIKTLNEIQNEFIENLDIWLSSQ